MTILSMIKGVLGIRELPSIRIDINPRIAANSIRYIHNSQRQMVPANEYLQREAFNALRLARETLIDDKRNGGRHLNRINGEGNIPAHWHIAYSAGFPISELKSTIDEYLEQLEYFDEVFSAIWQPARRIIDVRYQLEEALKALAWLVGMQATPTQLERYLACCGAPGQDALFDRIVCQLGFARPVANRLLMPTDHQPLMTLIDAPSADRPKLAAKALEKWARALTRSGAPSKPGDLGYVGQWDLPLALVVMLWDVDDTGLHDQPHYPKDLVAHYRTQGGRVLPPVSGKTMSAPAPCARMNLDHSPAAGLERWLALASDGDAAAVAATLKSLEEAGSLDTGAHLAFGILAEHGQAVCADLKDDETLAAQLQVLIDERVSGGGFDSNDVDGCSGIVRCEALLEHAQAWLAQSAGNYCLLRYNGGQEDWLALLVRHKHVEELMTLSQQLRLPGRLA